MWIVTFTRLALSLSMLLLLQSCGGGGSAAADPQLRFIVDYLPTATPIAPAGNILVSPFPGDLTIGTQAVAKVELSVGGYPPQVLTAPNSETKDTLQMRWVFALPAGFASGSAPCGLGAYATQVTATDVTGFSLSKSFELCPGTAFETTASSS